MLRIGNDTGRSLWPTRDKEDELSKQIYLCEIKKSMRIQNIHFNFPKPIKRLELHTNSDNIHYASRFVPRYIVCLYEITIDIIKVSLRCPIPLLFSTPLLFEPNVWVCAIRKRTTLLKI